MKNEYDFSKGIRGKFYREDINLNIPVYLDEKNYKYVKSIADKNKEDISSVVNELLDNFYKIHHHS